MCVLESTADSLIIQRDAASATNLPETELLIQPKAEFVEGDHARLLTCVTFVSGVSDICYSIKNRFFARIRVGWKRFVY
jgi:hypothetical protein